MKSFTLLPLQRNLNHENGAREARVCSELVSEEEWRKKNQSWLLHMESFFQQQTVTSVTATFYSPVVCLPHKFLPCCHLYLCLSSSLRCSSGSPRIRERGCLHDFAGVQQERKAGFLCIYQPTVWPYWVNAVSVRLCFYSHDGMKA